MRLFNRWFGKSPPPASQSRPEAEGEPRREEPTRTPPAPTPVPPDSATGPLVIPPGHKLISVSVPEELAPSMNFLEGGICIASLGQGSDEPVEEVETLLRKHEAWLKDPRRISLVSQEEHLLRLFGPSPSTTVIPRAVIWVFSPRALCALLMMPASLQALLRHLYRLKASARQTLLQYMFFEPDCGPLGMVMARLLVGLGLRDVRTLDPDDPERRVLFEVHRPDGTVIAGLRGFPLKLEGAVEDFLLRVNVEKDQAEARGDAPRLRQLEQQERDYLVRELQPIQPLLHKLPLVRAPRLCRLLRTAADQASPTARQAVEQELLERTLPLLFLMHPGGKGAITATFHGVGSALRVYPDYLSLTQAVKEMELPADSYVISGMAARDMFDWMASQNCTVALNVYMTAYMPTYVFWLPKDLRLLAQGQLASRA